MKILVSRLGMVGDTFFTIPALKNIRAHFPHAEIWYVAAPRGAPVISQYHLADKVIVYDIYHPRIARWRVRRKLKGMQFDYYFNMDTLPAYHNFFMSVIRAQTVCRMVRQIENDGSVQVVQSATNDLHICLEHNELLREAGIPVPHERYTLEKLSVGALWWSRYFEARFDKRLGHKLVGIHPGNHALNTNTLFKKMGFDPRSWRLDYYVELAEALHKENPNLIFILTGGFYERKLTNKIEQGMKECGVPVANLAGKTANFNKFMGLLLSLDLMICGDTGSMHAAAAAKVPLVGLFCSTDPKDTGPYGDADRSIEISAGLPCSPCMHTAHAYQCPPDTNCVVALTPQLVLRKAGPFFEKYLKSGDF